MINGTTITVLERQTIYDLGLQYYGDADGYQLLFLDNPGLPGHNTRLIGGTLLKIKSAPINKEIVAHYKANGIVPVSEVENYDAFFHSFQLLQDGSFQLLQDGSRQTLQ